MPLNEFSQRKNIPYMNGLPIKIRAHQAHFRAWHYGCFNQLQMMVKGVTNAKWNLFRGLGDGNGRT